MSRNTDAASTRIERGTLAWIIDITGPLGIAPNIVAATWAANANFRFGANSTPRMHGNVNR